MKKIIAVILIFSAMVAAQQAPFNRGVNLSGWFEASSARQIQFTKYTHEDFVQLKSLGVDVVRLPINLHYMTSGSPDYTLDPLFVYFLDQVADWAEEQGINLILDNHTFDVTQSTSTDIDKVLIPVWTQMASHFKNRSKKIFYEVLNEPHGISDVRWNQIQQAVVDSIRKVDTTHTIIVGPANWNSYNNLSLMPVYSDKNLIYTFHFYDPFIFTHQGASWSSPSMVDLAGVPFPYNAAKMPACPQSLKGTWIESNMNNYKSDGTFQKVQGLLNTAVNFQRTRNVPLYCGEFGVYIPNSPDSDRVVWYELVRKYLEQNNIAWTTWDYKGGFGLFKKDSDELFNYDLNTSLLTALGLNVPAQSVFIQRPDTTGFDLYTDYVGKNINNQSYSSGTLDFYTDQNSYAGNYCVYWSGAKRYEAISFDFQPNRDLSVLKSENYVLDCMIKGNLSSIAFDLRFVDSKTSDPNDHPWRCVYKIDNSKVSFDDTWHELRIPLKDFYETGAWDNNTWYTQIGKFDWKDINLFELVAEYSDLSSAKLWFDNIKITSPAASAVAKVNSLPASFYLQQNYPNPFNPSTTIKFGIPITANDNSRKSSHVVLKVYDVLGREVATLVNADKVPGEYTVEFSSAAAKLSSGIYFYLLRAGNEYVQSRKMILMK